MLDLVAPMLVVMKDEAEDFWCFAALIDWLRYYPPCPLCPVLLTSCIHCDWRPHLFGSITIGG